MTFNVRIHKKQACVLCGKEATVLHAAPADAPCLECSKDIDERERLRRAQMQMPFDGGDRPTVQ